MPTTKAAYWQEMKEKAAANIAKVSEWLKPIDEEGVKEHVAHVMKLGSAKDKAEVLVEATEFMIACHMLKTYAMPA